VSPAQSRRLARHVPHPRCHIYRIVCFVLSSRPVHPLWPRCDLNSSTMPFEMSASAGVEEHTRPRRSVRIRRPSPRRSRSRCACFVSLEMAGFRRRRCQQSCQSTTTNFAKRQLMWPSDILHSIDPAAGIVMTHNTRGRLRRGADAGACRPALPSSGRGAVGSGAHRPTKRNALAMRP